MFYMMDDQSQTQMCTTENEDLESALFEWFCQERLAGILFDGSVIKDKANHFHGTLVD